MGASHLGGASHDDGGDYGGGYGDEDEDDNDFLQYNKTPVKKRVAKAKKSQFKTKEIDELKSEYQEALGILRDVVERMQDTDKEVENGVLSPMIKRR